MKTEKILLIEDNREWTRGFKRILDIIGEPRELIRQDYSGFKEQFQSAQDFDDISFCLVDLELGPASRPDINDYLGLEVVLPIIRNLAPWIPTACLSRHITGDANIVGRLSVSDFDGIYPKETIAQVEVDILRTSPTFNYEKWNGILENLTLRRNSSVTGLPVHFMKQKLKAAQEIRLVKGKSIETELAKMGGDEILKEALALMNFGGKKIAVDEIELGFSGICTCKVSIFEKEAPGLERPCWLLKWGRPIRKVAEEARAHRRILRQGLDREIIVPQYHQHSISWRGFGFMAYWFERDSITALKLLETEDLRKFSKHFEKLAKSLYALAEGSPISAAEELKRWWGINAEKENCFSKMDLNKTLEVTYSMLHGDFHLRNILITKAERPTLIDFAKSDVGPVVVDLAKLFMDILLFIRPESISREIFTWNGLDKTPLATLKEKAAPFLSSSNDDYFFEVAMRAYALKYLGYRDIEESAKTALKMALEI